MSLRRTSTTRAEGVSPSPRSGSSNGATRMGRAAVTTATPPGTGGAVPSGLVTVTTVEVGRALVRNGYRLDHWDRTPDVSSIRDRHQ